MTVGTQVEMVMTEYAGVDATTTGTELLAAGTVLAGGVYAGALLAATTVL